MPIKYIYFISNSIQRLLDPISSIKLYKMTTVLQCDNDIINTILHSAILIPRRPRRKKKNKII